MNKKIKKCENYEFLPEVYQNREDLSMSEKNVLATLCYLSMRYHDYTYEHDGWFFTSAKELETESGIDRATVFRNLLKLEIKKVVYRKSGTNHRCTHYKLCYELADLLPKFEEPEESNATLVKKRIDEYSKDESILLDKKSKTEIGSLSTPSKGAAPMELDYDNWCKKIKERLELVTDSYEMSVTGRKMREEFEHLPGALSSKLNKYLTEMVIERKKEIEVLMASAPTTT